MKLAQVTDFADLYRGHDSHLCVYYVEPNGNHGKVVVLNPPHTVFKAVGDTFPGLNCCDAITEIVSSLNEHIARNPPDCNHMECSCNGDKYGVFRYPCIRRLRESGVKLPPAVVSACIVYAKGCLVHENVERPYLQVTVSRSFYMHAVCEYLERHRYGNYDPKHDGVYDKKANGVDSFILSKRVSSFDWIEFPWSDYVNYDEIRVVTNEADRDEAPLVCLYVSIDIAANDCDSKIGSYQESKLAGRAYPVGAISMVLSCGPHDVKRRTLVLESGECQDTVFCKSEGDLLMAFRQYVIDSDVDVVFVYCSGVSDFPYLLDRASMLGLSQFRYFSRDPNEPVVYRKEQYESARGVFKINCPGRIFYDVESAVRDVYKFHSYRLRDVAAELGLTVLSGLKMQDRSIENANLTFAIAESVMDLSRRMRVMCRTMGVSAREMPDRGKMYLLGMMLRRELGNGYMLKTKRNTDPLEPALMEIDGYQDLWNKAKKGQAYPGGFVFEPEVGIWNCCVLTLDFKSLYPSIISTFNICPTTQVSTSYAIVAPSNSINVSPAGYAYVKQDTHKGVFPILVERLMASRSLVKAKMSTEVDLVRRKMYDIEQGVLKMCANALYGFLGSLKSMISSLTGAHSITSYGRYYIQLICDALMELPNFEEKYGIQVERPGFVEKYGLRIIYGDTDSLFVALTKVGDAADVMSTIGLEIMQWVNKNSKLLTGRLEMELECCSMPFLLVCKKKYVQVLTNKDGSNEPYVELSGIDNRSITKYTSTVLRRVLQLALVERATSFKIDEAISLACDRIWKGDVPAALLCHSDELARPLHTYQGDSFHVVAARQLQAAGIHVVEGCRVAYYYCQPNKPTFANKSELVVAADLYESSHVLHAKSYIDELKSTLEHTVLCFVGGETQQSKLARLNALCNGGVLHDPISSSSNSGEVHRGWAVSTGSKKRRKNCPHGISMDEFFSS